MFRLAFAAVCPNVAQPAAILLCLLASQSIKPCITSSKEVVHTGTDGTGRS